MVVDHRRLAADRSRREALTRGCPRFSGRMRTSPSPDPAGLAGAVRGLALVTRDNLLTSPCAVGAQGRSADLPARATTATTSATSSLPVDAAGRDEAWRHRRAHVGGLAGTSPMVNSHDTVIDVGWMGHSVSTPPVASSRCCHPTRVRNSRNAHGPRRFARRGARLCLVLSPSTPIARALPIQS